MKALRKFWSDASGVVRVYCVIGVVTTVLLLSVEALGWKATGPQERTIPADVRSSPGGYRSFHFWHSGYEGGK